MIPKVGIKAARAFSQEWNRNRSVSLIFKDSELQFAADFANVILAQFVAQYIQQQEEKKVKLTDL
jgi:hypothetical protein